MQDHKYLLDHKEWLRIAKEDFMVAKVLIKKKFYSSVTYHCQQAAEKTLKAYLVLKDQPVLKTHDLTKLVELCMQKDGTFKDVYIYARYLNPFSTKFRYPSEHDIPDYNHAENSIKQTRKLMNFVLKKISEPETGQTKIFH
jgi:HEPN domain-containing protein